MKTVELRAIKTPACWSWSVPELLTEVDLTAVLSQHGLRPHISSNASAGPAAAWQFVAFHAGRCAICGQPTGLLVVDHDHGARTVRGCLCYACNALEGRPDADLPVITLYRRRHPAQILGYHERFAGNGACQRILRVVHAAARARRYREIRIGDVTSDLRRLAGHPAIQDDAAAERSSRLADAWHTVRSRGAQLDDQLLDDLLAALARCHFLTSSKVLPYEVQFSAEQLQRSIRHLCVDVAKELGREVAVLRFL